MEQAQEKLTRKEKRRLKLKHKLLNPVDIKYQGPLSYRALRIIAWVCFALGQIVIINTFGSNVMVWNGFSGGWKTIFNLLSSLSTPLFIIAAFSLVLKGRKSFKSLLLFYGGAFFGIGLGLLFFYLRYVRGLFIKLEISETDLAEMTRSFVASHAQVNVFSDLFMFALFHFFINYTPIKKFKGKKIYIFRSLSLIPCIMILVSYLLKVNVGLGNIELPVGLYPFLTTKSPLVYMVFVVISLWINYRERLFIRLGATKAEYHQFLKTNRNSLSFSITLSILILISFVIEFIFLFILYGAYYELTGGDTDLFMIIAGIYGVGQCIPLILAIPFILLFSYVREHKNPMIDTFIPFVGIGLTVIVYLEGIFQLIVKLVAE